MNQQLALTPVARRGPYERVMAKTRREGACLVFTGSARDDRGYGFVTHNGKRLSAHRVVWEHHHGAITGGLFVLHRCDNGWCVEINHLFTGTHAENMRDMVGKNRQARGERIGISALTVEKVQAIRLEHSQGASQRGLARQYGVNKRAVHEIVHRRTWRHV